MKKNQARFPTLIPISLIVFGLSAFPLVAHADSDFYSKSEQIEKLSVLNSLNNDEDIKTVMHPTSSMPIATEDENNVVEK